jgi:hypothetical protein
MATLQEINDIIAAIQKAPPPPVPPAFVNSLLPLTFDQAVNAVQADAYTQNVVNPVIREYQAAFGTVPDQAGLAFWVQQFGTGQVSLAELSFTFASSQQFFNTYGVGPTAPPTAGLITALYQNVLERAPDQAGLNFWLNSGLNASQLLEEFAQSGEFIQNTNPNIIAFQNAEVAGNAPVPPTSLFDVETTGFDLTINVDTKIEAVDNPVFVAPPGANALGPSNTLNAGDTIESLAGNGTLNWTAVTSPFGNPPLVSGVNMTGVTTANILNTSLGGTAGFSGNINGLTNVSVLGGSTGDILLGLAGAGLNTALETINLNASQDFTAWMTAAALSGAADSVQLTLNAVSDNFDPQAFIDLLVSSGTNAYEEVHITSSGAANDVVLNTNGETTNLITVDGDQDLTITDGDTIPGVDGNLLDVEWLETFDGSAATGNLFVGDPDEALDNFGAIGTGFHGTGDVTALGGSGNDHFVFLVDGAVDASGNDGDDIFSFETFNTDPTTFGIDDVVNGGAGLNELRLQADTGVLLAAGVGANITNIDTIVHYTNGFANGDIDINMAEAGSATTIELAGDYNFNGVTITNLTNNDTVVFSGSQLGIINDGLELHHTLANGGIYNLVMAQNDIGGTLDLNDLELLNPGLLLNIESIGNADLNDIDTADWIDANVNITGDTDLDLGAQNFAYDFLNGLIDASLFTGNLTTFLEDDTTAIGGSGDDTIWFMNDHDTLANIAAGGADTVVFTEANNNENQQLSNNDYNHVTGWSDDDVVAIDIPFDNLSNPPLDETDGTPVGSGDASNILLYTTGADIDADTSDFNFILVTTPVATAGNNAEEGFDDAMGGGSIDVNNVDSILLGYYDLQNSQMVIVAVDSPGNVVNAGDNVDVVGTIAMSQADFNAFDNSNLAFV